MPPRVIEMQRLDIPEPPVQEEPSVESKPFPVTIQGSSGSLLSSIESGQSEHQKMTETSKIFGWNRMFNWENYKEQAIDSFKVFLAPISLSLTVALAPGAIASKMGYIFFIIPGFFADFLYAVPLFLNKALASLTYPSIHKLATDLLNAHLILYP